jgi:hypothetical protein
VKVLIESSAISDGFTGPVPNDQWGFGKLDVAAALFLLMPAPDTNGPTIGSHNRMPFTPNSTESVILNVAVSDPSGVDTVILSYYNGTTWQNITMVLTGAYYEATIPPYPNGTAVSYRFYANDTLNNWSTSATYSYTVTDPGTTTTTTSTGTTTTTGGPTSTTPPPEEPSYLRLAVMLSAILALIVLTVIFNKRRSREPR